MAVLLPLLPERCEGVKCASVHTELPIIDCPSFPQWLPKVNTSFWSRELTIFGHLECLQLLWHSFSFVSDDFACWDNIETDHHFKGSHHLYFKWEYYMDRDYKDQSICWGKCNRDSILLAFDILPRKFFVMSSGPMQGLVTSIDRI